ncbi:hypothetical protein BJF79_18050 [Actinomadura sp. CNU-125]|uniref:hypothetical protein n=1 Tax=Actinomadura sp. CNU-125 TaxID=1904961 RepID=UPI000969AE5A|nr:hypothetical protein [Actinomadura sp. CNU-125]OLT17011.1 hypothetical protein BJF79_18050 [Actinomadura sp. CNU-125]
MAATGFESVRAVADAILYEGYLLYPYRRSSGKNRVRWQFGVLTPRSWADAHGLDDTSVAGSAESWWQQTECLLEAPEDATVTCRLRFLQLQRRTVERRAPDGTFEEVGALGTHLPFDEAVPREFDFAAPLAELLAGGRRFAVRAPAGAEREPADGGRIARRRLDVDAVVTVSAARCDTPSPAYRLRVRVENGHAADRAAASRDAVLHWSLLAAHTMIAVVDGAFVSLLDPPRWAEDAARECANVHTFPVLAGPEGAREIVLSSPILLYDHPRIAPESPGDLHDATEIDEILSLRTMTLTDAEKREARATDPRAAEILDRVDGMPHEVFERLHGAVRSLGPLPKREPDPGPDHDPEPDRTPWWDPGADASVSPDTDTVTVSGVALSRGSRVRLRPRSHGTDPQDRFLDGRTAVVEAVLLDVDDACHLAVSLEEDPAAELNRWYGRYRYFAPDEVEPLADERSPR